jgi:hypothetical protein
MRDLPPGYRFAHPGYETVSIYCQTSRPITPGDVTNDDAQMHSRGIICPGLVWLNHPRNHEGAGSAGCTSHPRLALLTRTPQVRRNTGTPCAMVYGLYALSPESGLVSLRRLELIIRDLIPASGDQDHAISLVRPRIARLATQRRPSHPASNVRDGRDTSPPEGSGCADMIMNL